MYLMEKNLAEREEKLSGSQLYHQAELLFVFPIDFRKAIFPGGGGVGGVI